MAFGILEAVFLALGIEVATRRLEVRPFTFGNLMEVNGMLSGRQIVEFELKRDARSLIPNDDVADGFP